MSTVTKTQLIAAVTRLQEARKQWLDTEQPYSKEMLEGPILEVAELSASPSVEDTAEAKWYAMKCDNFIIEFTKWASDRTLQIEYEHGTPEMWASLELCSQHSPNLPSANLIESVKVMHNEHKKSMHAIAEELGLYDHNGEPSAKMAQEEHDIPGTHVNENWKSPHRTRWEQEQKAEWDKRQEAIATVAKENAESGMGTNVEEPVFQDETPPPTEDIMELASLPGMTTQAMFQTGKYRKRDKNGTMVTMNAWTEEECMEALAKATGKNSLDPKSVSKHKTEIDSLQDYFEFDDMNEQVIAMGMDGVSPHHITLRLKRQHPQIKLKTVKEILANEATDTNTNEEKPPTSKPKTRNRKTNEQQSKA